MNTSDIILAIGGGGGALGVIVGAMRSKHLRPVLMRILTSDIDIRQAVESLKTVVSAQGESIEWLREELENARTELMEARAAVRATEELTRENIQLRARILELESHVARLETQLNSRKKSS